MVHAHIWEVLQWCGSRITAVSGKMIGGEIHKSSIVEKTGEVGR